MILFPILEKRNSIFISATSATSKKHQAGNQRSVGSRKILPLTRVFYWKNKNLFSSKIHIFLNLFLLKARVLFIFKRGPRNLPSATQICIWLSLQVGPSSSCCLFLSSEIWRQHVRETANQLLPISSQGAEDVSGS